MLLRVLSLPILVFFVCDARLTAGPVAWLQKGARWKGRAVRRRWDWSGSNYGDLALWPWEGGGRHTYSFSGDSETSVGVCPLSTAPSQPARDFRGRSLHNYDTEYLHRCKTKHAIDVVPCLHSFFVSVTKIRHVCVRDKHQALGTALPDSVHIAQRLPQSDNYARSGLCMPVFSVFPCPRT